MDAKRQRIADAIYRVGREKARITEARNKLIQTGLADKFPEVKRTIEILKQEHERLSNSCVID